MTNKVQMAKNKAQALTKQALTTLNKPKNIKIISLIKKNAYTKSKKNSYTNRSRYLLKKIFLTLKLMILKILSFKITLLIHVRKFPFLKLK